MLHSVFERTLHDQRRALIGWVVGIAMWAAMILAVYPTFRDNDKLSDLIANYPEALKSMFGVNDFRSAAGYLHGELFSLMVPLLLVVYAVLLGGDATCGEEDRHTIDLLLANPVPRWRVVTDKFAALVVAVAVMGAAVAVALVAGGPLVRLHLSLARLVQATVGSVLLGVVFGALAMAVGAATGRRGLARAVGTALAVTAYLVSGLSGVVHGLKPWRTLSPWWHAVGVEPLRHGLALVDASVLVGLVVVFVGAALWAFERRDLAV